MKNNIIFSFNNLKYNLGGIEFKCKLDGSLYIFLKRKGFSKKSWDYFVDTKTSVVSQVQLHEVKQNKTTKISYHTSGRVNYEKEGGNQQVAYLEPLTKVKNTTLLLAYSLPSIRKLNPYSTNIKPTDLLISLPKTIKGRVNVTFVISPWNCVLKGKVYTTSIKFFDLFSLSILINQEKLPVPDIIRNTFIILKNPGIYSCQQITEDQAALDFQHHLNNNRDLIIYSPNKERDI